MLGRVFKTGYSVVISLPKDALDYLGLEEGANVSVDLDRERRQIVITPAAAPLAVAGVNVTFAHQVSEFIEQYRVALETLAKDSKSLC